MLIGVTLCVCVCVSVCVSVCLCLCVYKEAEISRVFLFLDGEKVKRKNASQCLDNKGVTSAFVGSTRDAFIAT